MNGLGDNGRKLIYTTDSYAADIKYCNTLEEVLIHITSLIGTFGKDASYSISTSYDGGLDESITTCRLETDDEYHARVNKEYNDKQRQEARERAELERLKAKYE